ncbi:ferredoxin [Streptomyces sp. NPDC051452]|uniref:ferredoxin n=1 Tax=Streptomyces sp. NPDC051452 TaxID=3365654 RepID=UPI00379738F8
MTLRISVDRERCCGAGMCALSAPDVFDQRDTDGRVVLLERFAPRESEKSVRIASENCPCKAISVTSVLGSGCEAE